jgi:hypothetical protein
LWLSFYILIGIERWLRKFVEEERVSLLYKILMLAQKIIMREIAIEEKKNGKEQYEEWYRTGQEIGWDWFSKSC